MSADKPKVETATDTLRLTPAQVEAIIAQLMSKQSQHPKAANDLRRSTRIEFRSEQPIAVTIEQMGGNPTRYAMYPWNLSNTGMAFLHGTFLYKGVKCVISLPKLDGSLCELPARIMRCRLITGRIHEVGVRFDANIDTAQFTRKTPPKIPLNPDRPPSWNDPALRPVLESFVRQLPVFLREFHPQTGLKNRAHWIAALEEFAQTAKTLCFHQIAQAGLDLFHAASQTEDPQPLIARHTVLRAFCEKTQIP